MLYKVNQLIRQIGLQNTVPYLINRIFRKFSLPFKFVKYYIVAQKISSIPILPRGKGEQIQIVELFNETLSQHQCPRPEPVIQDRYEQGAVCLAAFKDSEFAGCLWYVKRKYKEDEVNCMYELSSDHAVWDFDVYVAPKYRLSPVFLKLWEGASQRLLNDDCHWSFSRISAFNPMSLSSHKRMGAKILGWALFFKIGPIQLTLSDLSPFLHLSCGEKSYPTFRLNIPAQ